MNKLSSTATLTVTVTDANDNRPTFEQEAYSFSISETAPANQLIGTIMAKDLDYGRFGTQGIRYTLSGAGSQLFKVNNMGTITVAECQNAQQIVVNQTTANYRKKRQIIDQSTTNAKKVNLTIISEAGVLDVDDTMSSTEYYSPYLNGNDVTYRTFFTTNDDYMVMSDDSDEDTTTVSSLDTTINKNPNNTQHATAIDANSREIETIKQTKLPNDMKTDGSGHAPCLDYETQNVYFLTYKVSMLFLL